MATLETRLARIERTLADVNAPKTYSFAQIVRGSMLPEDMTDEERAKIVGPPEAPIVPGEPTFVELIGAAANRGSGGAAE